MAWGTPHRSSPLADRVIPRDILAAPRQYPGHQRQAWRRGPAKEGFQMLVAFLLLAGLLLWATGHMIVR